MRHVSRRERKIMHEVSLFGFPAVFVLYFIKHETQISIFLAAPFPGGINIYIRQGRHSHYFDTLRII